MFICLEDYCSVLLLSYYISSGALGSPDLLLSHSMIKLALHNTIILIIILSSFNPKITPKSTQAAAVREVKEETNLAVDKLTQFRIYSDPKRDQRRHTVSVVFRVQVSDLSTLHMGDDAKSVQVSL